MTVCSCERGALSQEQTVIQGVTTVTGEEHLREVMEGNRYPDTYKTASKPSTAAEPTEVSEAKSICFLTWHGQ